jgi:hypothetical protein
MASRDDSARERQDAARRLAAARNACAISTKAIIENKSYLISAQISKININEINL